MDPQQQEENHKLWLEMNQNHRDEATELFLKHRQERWELRQEEYLREKSLTNSQKEVAWCVPPTPQREDLCDEEIEELLRDEQDAWFIEMIREGPMKRRRLTHGEVKRIAMVGEMRNEEERKRKGKENKNKNCYH